jgi:glycosyltransferase involved in cell wall biosynthesis
MLTIAEYDSHPRVRRQAEALVARGDSVTAVALHADGRPALEMVDGVNVVRLPVRKYRGESAQAYLRLYGGFAARVAPWAARRIRDFDVVQVNTMPEALVFATMPHRLAGIPVLLDVHDRTAELFASKFREDGWMMSAIRFSERASLRFATEVITVHEPYAETLRELTGRPVSVVMNCPDERLFQPRPWRAWVPGRDVVFGYHGLIAPRHGLVQAVEALASLRADVPGARMRVWGCGDGLPSLQARVNELGLGSVVDLPVAAVPITQVATELASIHIGLVPSHLDPWTRRVLPTKLLEYAAVGIPVITFRNPIIEGCFPPDAVTYVDPVSAENLLAAMRLLAGDPERARRQAARAQDVLRNLTWRQQKGVYLDVIDRLSRHRGSMSLAGR